MLMRIAPLFKAPPTTTVSGKHGEWQWFQPQKSLFRVCRNSSAEVVSLEKNPAMASYFEALRDRLIVDFEVEGLGPPQAEARRSHQRQPGCRRHTLAAGLAASFSTTGDGHVLLVNMNTPTVRHSGSHSKAGTDWIWP